MIDDWSDIQISDKAQWCLGWCYLEGLFFLSLSEPGPFYGFVRSEIIHSECFNLQSLPVFLKFHY